MVSPPVAGQPARERESIVPPAAGQPARGVIDISPNASGPPKQGTSHVSTSPERNVVVAHGPANFNWFDMHSELERDLAFLLDNPNATSLPSAAAGQPAQPKAGMPEAAGQPAPRSTCQIVPNLVASSPSGSNVGGGAAGQPAPSQPAVDVGAAGQLAPHPVASQRPAG